MQKTREALRLSALPVLLLAALLPAQFHSPDNTPLTTPDPMHKVHDTLSAWTGLPQNESRRNCRGLPGKPAECPCWRASGWGAFLNEVVLEEVRDEGE